VDTVKQQYKWVKANRQVLFEFLEGIPFAKLHETVPGFGHGSIIGTHVHMLDCYRYWIGSFAAKENPSEFHDTPFEVIAEADVKKVRELFEKVDETVMQFLNDYEGRWSENVENDVEWMDTPMTAPSLFLISHAMTHEFHHRGQILSMARQLGHPSKDDRLGSLFS
jgi:uncharacterized damage-inducible protein DinB